MKFALRPCSVLLVPKRGETHCKLRIFSRILFYIMPHCCVTERIRGADILCTQETSESGSRAPLHGTVFGASSRDAS